MAYRVGGFIPSDRAEIRESTLPLASGRCGCQQRNAVNGKGHKGEGDQNSTEGQYLRQRHSTRRKFCTRFLELLKASAVYPKVVKHVSIRRFWKWVEQNNFEPFEVCQSALEDLLIVIVMVWSGTMVAGVQRFAVKQIKDHSSFSKSGFILFKQTKYQHSLSSFSSFS